MKTAIFTLAALFGLGLGLAAVGVEFGLQLVGLLLATLGVATLIWGLADGLLRHLSRAPRLRSRTSQNQGFHKLARLIARIRAIAAKAPRLPLAPLLSVLMGLSLGAALARDAADLPAAMLCGALAGALHLLATRPAPRPETAPALPRIACDTQAHLTRLIAALAPCRDPHLHVAARALRRTATTLADRVDASPATLPPNSLSNAHRALSLWLPALVEAAETLRQDHIHRPDPAQTAALTATLARVTDHLAALTPQAAPGDAPLGLATASA